MNDNSPKSQLAAREFQPLPQVIDRDRAADEANAAAAIRRWFTAWSAAGIFAEAHL